jgi:HEAT repeat protein
MDERRTNGRRRKEELGMNMRRTIWMLGLMIGVLAGQRVSAAELALGSVQAPTTNEGGGEQASEHSMATGRRKDASGAWTETAVPPAAGKRAAHPAAKARAIELRERLAAIELSIRVDRKLEDARRDLDELWMRAARKDRFAERAAVLAEIAVARAKLLLELGDRDAALAALGHALPDAGDRARLTDFELVAADADALADEEQALADPRVAELRRVISAPKPAPAAARALSGLGYTGAGDAGIEETVRAAFAANGDPQIIEQIGTRAVPILEQLVVSNLDQFAAKNLEDPYYWLEKLAPTRAAEVTLAHYDEGGFFWKKRVLRIFQHADKEIFGPNDWRLDPATPSPMHDVPPVSTQPEWILVYERLLGDPLVQRDALSVLGRLAARDALTPKMREHLSAMLEHGDSDLNSSIRSPLDIARGLESARPIFEAALGSREVATRRWAAESLTSYAQSDALRRAANDPDSRVRASVAVSLGKRSRSVTVWTSGNQFGPTNKAFAPELDAEARKLLATLAADVDAQVRGAVVSVLAASGADLVPPPILEALARDPASSVRAALATLDIEDLELLGRVKAILAADNDPTVLEALDRWLVEHVNQRLKQRSGLDHLLEMIRVRLHHPTHRLGAEAPPLGSIGPTDRAAWVLRTLAVTPRGMVEAARWVIELQDPKLVRGLAAGVHWDGKVDKENGSIAYLDDPLLERFLRAVYAAFAASSDSSDQQSLQHMVGGGLQQSDGARSGALLPILRDRSAPRALRVIAAAGSARAGGPAFEEGFVDLLRDASWLSQPSVDLERDLVRGNGLLIRPEDRERVFVHLIREPKTADELVIQVLIGWLGSSESRDPAKLRVLAGPLFERWPDPPANAEGVFGRVLGSLDAGSSTDREFLLRALEFPRLARYAIEAITRRPDPTFLEPLGQILRPSDDRAVDQQSQIAAAQALANYLDDQAAEKLLAGAASTNPNVRQACFSALETIRRYQDEKGRWRARQGGEAARLAAIDELLPLLEDRDPAIRAQSARSLATLQAVEHLPKLIALLKDPAPAVREAAQAALERLNENGKK